MNNNRKVNAARSSILAAIKNLIELNNKNNPYDKTFIGRIKTNNGNNSYDVIINGKTYQDVKGVSLFSFNINDTVYCLAPQGNLNQLRIVLNLKGNPVETIISKSLTPNGYIKYSSGLIIQWGSVSIAQDLRSVQMNLNISFTSTDYVVFLQLGTSTIDYYMNGSGIDSKSQSYFVYTTEYYANDMNWIAIGY